MKYRVTQSQITSNLNMIDEIIEKKLTDAEDKYNVGNGLHQIEADTESLCSYIDELHKTITDKDSYAQVLEQAIKNAETLIKEYEITLGINIREPKQVESK